MSEVQRLLVQLINKNGTRVEVSDENKLKVESSGVGGGALASEATLISVLNAIVASDQDIEILLVRDTGNADKVIQQITNYETGTPTVSYKDVNGNAYVPVGPLEYLDPSAVLNLMLTEILDQGITLDSVETLLTTIDAVLDAIKVDTANLDVALSTRATEATLLSTNVLLTTIDTVLDTIKTDTALINSNVVLGNITLNTIDTKIATTNSLLTTIDAVLDTIKLDTAKLDVDLSTRASEATLSAQAANIVTIESTLATLNAKLNTLGQKASAGSAPVVLSTEQEVILDAIKTAVESIDSDLGTGGLALETTQVAIQNLVTSTNALLTTIDADTSNLDVLLSTRAADASVLATNALLTTIDGVLDAIKIDTGALVVDVAAIEVLITNTNALLTTIDGVLDAIKLDTANLDVALSSRLNTLGRKAETASAPVVLSDEDFASLEAIRVAVQNLDVDVDGIATEVTLAALLTAFNAEDFATETTLAAVLAELQDTTGLNQEVTQLLVKAVLDAIKLQTDQMSFDGNSALEVSLPTGVVGSRYERLAGIGSYTVPPGNTKASILNYGSVPVTVDNGFGPVQLDPGVGLDFAAPEGKTLGAITTASTSASGLVAITQVGN